MIARLWASVGIVGGGSDMRTKLALAFMVTAVLGVGIGVLFAALGTTDSPGPPDDQASESYTLTDLYNRLTTGAAGSKTTFTEPASGPGTGTMHTLSDIMAVAPAQDSTNGATAVEVASGKTFWGLTSGAWGQQTGTMPGRFTDNGNGTVTDNHTGLIWLKDANCFGQQKWENAQSQVSSLNQGTCGLNDGSQSGSWRLPKSFELATLVDKRYGNDPVLSNAAGDAQWTEGDAFTGVQMSFYWTNDEYGGCDEGERIAWAIHMGNGLRYWDFPCGRELMVWPVRGYALGY
jgi:hypothetical protein